MRKDELDPLSYIEGAFMDVPKEDQAKAVVEAPALDIEKDVEDLRPFSRNMDTSPTVQVRPTQSAKDAPQPKEPTKQLVDAIRTAQKPQPEPPKKAARKTKTTQMNAPRPRKRRSPSRNEKVFAPEIEKIWQQLPKNMKFLASVYDDNVTQKYYSSGFKESREELILRMVDPQLNLEETARLLGVCPATIRRYTNRGWLEHHRTSGNQRRFRLSGIVDFVEKYGRNPE